MIDLDQLETLAKAATPGEWIARADGWTIRAYAGNELAADGVKVAHTCAMMMQGQGSKPDIEQQVANQEYIAAAQPKAILSLTAEIRQLRAELAACGDLMAEVVGLRSYKEMAQMQVYELMGVVVDIEQFGSGFDDACMNTVKRVMGVLGGKP